MERHIPVMAGEVMEYLAVRPDGVYIDCTTGPGGHSREIARRLEGGRLLCLDRDAESLEVARAELAEYGERIRYAQSRFSQLRLTLEQLEEKRTQGVVADLGVSRLQLTSPTRGFSLMVDSDLDMRMDRSTGEPASELVNYASERQIADLIYGLGEERRARKIARAIVRARPIRSTLALARVIEEAVPRTSKLHPATQTFMALRMYVNQELEEVEALLDAIPEVLAAGGRFVAITFHSLEDRLVKRRMKDWERDGIATILTRHVVRPQEEEVDRNAAARSAKLRCIERGEISMPMTGTEARRG